LEADEKCGNIFEGPIKILKTALERKGNTCASGGGKSFSVGTQVALLTRDSRSTDATTGHLFAVGTQ